MPENSLLQLPTPLCRVKCRMYVAVMRTVARGTHTSGESRTWRPCGRLSLRPGVSTDHRSTTSVIQTAQYPRPRKHRGLKPNDGAHHWLFPSRRWRRADSFSALRGPIYSVALRPTSTGGHCMILVNSQSCRACDVRNSCRGSLCWGV